jgi:hypothetical protein
VYLDLANVKPPINIRAGDTVQLKVITKSPLHSILSGLAFLQKKRQKQGGWGVGGGDAS